MDADLVAACTAARSPMAVHLTSCRRAHDQREVLGHAAGGNGDILGHVEEVSKVRDEHDAGYRRVRAASRIANQQPTEVASPNAG